MAVYLYILPQDDALLTAVGGVTPLVTFHRGDCTVAPENTLPAFRSAILKGGDRIELDVQMTSDGVVVVTHDSNLKRCTGKNAKVYDLTYAEVAQLDAGRWFSSRFADTRIPTLEQVLQLCRGRIGLNVEIKPSAATPALEAETVRLLREYGFDSSNCVITSYNKIVVFIDRSPAECYNKFRMLWIGGTSPTAKTVFGRLQPQLLC